MDKDGKCVAKWLLLFFLSADTTGRKVKVIVTDFVKENVFSEIEDQLRDLNIGVLGWINTTCNIKRSSPLLSSN